MAILVRVTLQSRRRCAFFLFILSLPIEKVKFHVIYDIVEMESLACVCVYSLAWVPPAHISYISMCHFPQRVLFQNGWRRLAAAIGYRIVYAAQANWVRPSVFPSRSASCVGLISPCGWLFFSPFVIRESLEEGIVKNIIHRCCWPSCVSLSFSLLVC